jgi:pimeloyl-ACP methyl ester carboxylesterase
MEPAEPLPSIPFSRLAGALLIAGSLSGCALGLLYPAPAHMRMSVHFLDEDHPTRCLIVFVPGFGDDENTFGRHGFIDALATRHMHVDTVSAAATFGYYPRHEVARRIREDVLDPLASRHYQQIWLVGVSMGGLGALLSAREQAGHIAGLFLMAPFLGDLGDHGLLEEIDKAGGLVGWGAAYRPHEDDQRDVWRYLKKVVEHPEGPPVVYLGAGEKDPLDYGHILLAQALPRERVFATPGGHDWGPWMVIWAKFLDESDFRARCSP